MKHEGANLEQRCSQRVRKAGEEVGRSRSVEVPPPMAPEETTGDEEVMNKQSSQSSNVSDLIEEVLFFDDPSISRGTSINKVLRCGYTTFVNSAGSAETYNLSQEVEQLDYFMSHNWSSPAFTKYLILLLHENLALAVICAQIVCCCMFVLGVFGFLPPFIAVNGGRRSIYCVIASTACFWLMLSFGHHVKRVIFCRPSYIFLDKICIHQTDKSLQRKGIANLGAFLSVSKAMLIVKGEAYFRKLWTVYDFATYTISAAKLGQTCRINIFTAAMPWAILAIYFTLFISSCALVAVPAWRFPISGEPTNWSEQLFYFASALASHPFFIFPIAVACRKLARDRIANVQELKVFSVRHVNCSVESDRLLVQRNIATFMEYAGFVSAGSTETEQGRQKALDKFDSIVQDNCTHLIDAYIGKQDLPYLYVQACSLCLLQSGVDLAVDRCSQGTDLRYAFPIFQFFVFTQCICSVETVLFLSMLAYKFQHLKGWRELAWLIAMAVAGALLNNMLRFSELVLTQLALSIHWVWCLVATYWLMLATRQWLAFRTVRAHIDFDKVLGSAEVEEPEKPAEPEKQADHTDVFAV